MTAPAPRRVLIIGGTGGIGSALAARYAASDPVERVDVAARRPGESSGKITAHRADITDEASLRQLAETIGQPDLVIVASGILSDGLELQPEKSFKQQEWDAFQRVFAVNTFGPALAAKHILPRMPRDRRAVFAALSARVGSISDNGLGGWHAYRASKAALNMLLRNYAIEMARLNPAFVCAGLHPGTVRTPLSDPFSRRVPDSQLFEPDEAAARLAQVIETLTPADSGKVFDWAGKTIPP